MNTTLRERGMSRDYPGSCQTGSFKKAILFVAVDRDARVMLDSRLFGRRSVDPWTNWPTSANRTK